jgi:hypothetical protein
MLVSSTNSVKEPEDECMLVGEFVVEDVGNK